MRTQSIMNMALIIVMISGLILQAAPWEIDKSHSEVGFAVKHMVVSDEVILILRAELVLQK
ncbi:hypothetical protein JW998_07175 [candidate division KSB1 bacterium]|nr:hypothetical protein [candidate division KSB1 bacterium]